MSVYKNYIRKTSITNQCHKHSGSVLLLLTQPLYIVYISTFQELWHFIQMESAM